MSKYNLLFPLDVTKIEVISSFGMRVHPVTKKYVLHEGIDPAAKKHHVDGDDVFASEDCEVRNSAWNNAGGNYMCLHGASGLYYNYQHLSKRNYSAGQKVSRGTVISQMGNTGSSTTGTHLHFAIGTSCTPAGFIPKSTKIALNPMDTSLFNWSFKANEVSQPVVTPTPSNNKYRVTVELNGYMSAANAKARLTPRVRVKVGDYDIFNTSQGMINVTKTAGTPGSWINPADNIVVASAPITSNEYKIKVVCHALKVRDKPSIVGKLVTIYGEGTIVNVTPYNSTYAKVVGINAYISIKSAYTKRV